MSTPGRVLPLLLLLAVPARGRPSDLHPPPPGHWARDTTGRISATTLATLDGIAAAVDGSGSGQLGICVTATTEGDDPRTYATAVFNHWGVGSAARNDGVLLFVALDDRKAEIILGSGSALRTSATDEIMRRDVVANFRAGRIDAALIEGARALAALLSAQRPPVVDHTLEPYVRGERPFPERSPRSWVVDVGEVLRASTRGELDVMSNELYGEGKARLFVLVFDIQGTSPALAHLVRAFTTQVKPLSGLPLAVVAFDRASGELDVQVPTAVIPTRHEQGVVQRRRRELAAQLAARGPSALTEVSRQVAAWMTTGIPPRPTAEVLEEGLRTHKSSVLGTLTLSLVGGLVGVARWWRRRPRHCKDCHQPRERLSEASDDEHLDEGQRKEEALGSVDYDVWWCGRCRDALVVEYTAFFSRYSRCVSCHRRTGRSSSTTIRAATEYEGGLVEIHTTCEHCGYSGTTTRATARLTPRSSSSSSSSSSWSSSSSSSFGGGSSRGSGSSGSW